MKNLSVEYKPNENKFEQILDLRAFNIYKNNIMKIVKEMGKDSLKNNLETAYNLTTTNDFIEKNLEKIKKVLEKEKLLKKNQDVEILKNFKKENKELLTYLLSEAFDEHACVENIKKDMLQQFEEINTTSLYFVKKSLRKIMI